MQANEKRHGTTKTKLLANRKQTTPINPVPPTPLSDEVSANCNSHSKTILKKFFFQVKISNFATTKPINWSSNKGV